MARNVEVPEYEVHEEVRLDPAHTELIVVDMQNDSLKEGGAFVVPDAEDAIPEIQNLFQLARESGMKVVYTQDTHGERGRGRDPQGLWRHGLLGLPRADRPRRDAMR